jgi:dTMP kinase
MPTETLEIPAIQIPHLAETKILSSPILEKRADDSWSLSAARTIIPREVRDGSLFVVEGVDGSGKSTQMEMVGNWLASNGFAVVTTGWTSSETIRPLIKKIKNREILVSPYVFSLLYVADFAERCAKIIHGALKAGKIVLADRYVYTALARDHARGIPHNWIAQAYRFAPQPDLAFYFRVSPDIAISRKSAPPKFYEAGMDLGLADNPAAAFRIFQRRVIDEYEKMIGRYNLNVFNGEDRLYETFPKVRGKIEEFIKAKYGIELK